MSDLASLEKMIVFIKEDLKKCIDCGVNFGLALLLSAYTELFGHLLTGLSGSGSDGKSYNAWLRYMGEPYSKILDGGVDLYGKIRCGLIHEYTIKDNACIFTEKGPAAIEIKDGVIRLNNWEYYQDFIKSLDRYLNDIKIDSSLREYFNNFRNGKPIVA